MATINQVSGYRVSRDYRRLADLMRERSIVCLVDHAVSETACVRDIAKTSFEPRDDTEGVYQVSVRGYGYVYARSADEFVAECVRVNLEFIPPDAGAAKASIRPVPQAYSGPFRVRMDVAALDHVGLRKAAFGLLDMIEQSPSSPGWSFGCVDGNGTADPVILRTAVHSDTGRRIPWPEKDPLPAGYRYEDARSSIASQP